MPEPEVLADHHPGRVQLVHQHRPDELIRGQPGELERERDDADGVHAEPGEQLRPAPGVHSNGGWVPGRTTSSGCGSNVTTTTGSRISLAAALARATIRW